MNKYDETAKMIQALKLLSKRWNVPIITAEQKKGKGDRDE